MNNSVHENLIVGDEDEVRKQRGIKKRELTKKLSKLKSLLQVSSDSQDQSVVVRQEVVTDVFERMKTLLTSVVDLHDRVQLLREPDADGTKEETLLSNEDAYLEKVEETYYEGLAIYSQYIEQLNTEKIKTVESEERKKVVDEEKTVTGQVDLDEVQDLLEKAITEYQVVKVSADKMVKQVEDFSFNKMVESITVRGLTASSKREQLQCCLREVVNLLGTFQSCARKTGQKIERKNIEFDYYVEKEKSLEMEDKLEKIVLAQQSLGQATTNVIGSSSSPADTTRTSPIKMAKVTLSKFSGEYRDYAKWRSQFLKIVVPNRPGAEVALYLKEAVPKKFEYLFNGTEVDNFNEMLRLMDEKFADERMILDSMMTSIMKLKVPDTDPKFVNFVNDVQSLHLDATNIGKLGEYANPQTLSAIEARFPEYVRLRWAEHVVEKRLNKKDTGERYDAMMEFLKMSKEMAEYNGSEMMKASAGRTAMSHYCTGVTMTTRTQPPSKVTGTWDPCLACKNSHDKKESLHQTSTCQKWLALSDKQKRETVPCVKHPFGNKDGHTTQNCKGPVGAYLRKCRHCGSQHHHGIFCTSVQRSKTNTAKSERVSKTMMTKTLLPPVLLQTNYVKTIKQRELGALWDLASTDDYIRNDTAKELGLRGIPVTLVVEAIKGQESVQDTMLYDVPVYTRKNKKRIYKCYGLDEITSGSAMPEGYDDICAKFGKAPGVMRRPSRIDILISMRRHRDHPKLALTISDMSIFDGPFGPVFGGSDGGLQFIPHHLSCLVKTLQGATSALTFRAAVKSVSLLTSIKSEKEFLNYFKEDAIGVDVKPECGSCRCGQCALGAKPMSLKQERKLEKFKQNLKYEPEGVPGDPGPYWRTSYEWTLDKDTLPDNYRAVYATMKRTEKKLQSDPAWSELYDQQLTELIEKGFARELLPGELEEWTKSGGKSYYIAHQMVHHPNNKSTPIRVVFNSSQRYQGFSLNTSWDLGPDMMTNLQTVLIRFRRDVVGAQGDIKKMFYAIRVEKEDSFMQLWIWKFGGEEKVRVFYMQRLVMGNMPSSNISIVAVHKTANLFDFKTKHPNTYETLTKDSYVDNVFVTAGDQVELNNKIEEVEHVCSNGGFYFKPWMKTGACEGVMKISGQGGSADVYDEVEKALGVYWNMKTDEMFIKLSLSEEEMDLITPATVQDNAQNGEEIISGRCKSLKPKLSIRICLSYHARCFDPMGFVFPTRMIGNLLFRFSIQTLKKDLLGRVPWDESLPENLVSDWLDYFQMLLQLETIKFPRSFKPDNVDPAVKPDLVTFTDGNPHSYGAVAYVRWTLLDGDKEARLLMSKAKLGALLQLGETVRNELNGATFGSRLKDYLYKVLGIEFGHHFPLLDSMIVKDMIQKDSYGFNTFAGLRVGEIQQKTVVGDWIHIPSKENIADVLTKGVPPNQLGPGSIWQTGPSWLLKDQSEWPVVKSKENISTDVEIEKFCLKTKPKSKSKSCLTLVCEAQPVKNTTSPSHYKLVIDSISLSKLYARSNKLESIVRVLAWMLRMTRGTSGLGELPCNSKMIFQRELTAGEYDDSWKYLVYLEQKERLIRQDSKYLVPKVIQVKLDSYDMTVPHIVIGGRVRNFPVAFGLQQEIPIIPSGPLAKRILLWYHDRYHCDVDTVVAHVRQDCWVVKARMHAAIWDRKCRICLEKRKHKMKQVMGDMPDFKYTTMPAWTCVNMDLFGPIIIRDDCVKKGPRVMKKVWGVLFTCTRIRAIWLDVATDYSTEAILHTIRRLMVNKGNIKLVVSDPGSQLKSCSKELSSWRASWSEEQLVRFGSSRGLTWKFVMAASQHQNGPAESMVKLVKGVKKSLLHAMGDTKLSLNELNTMLAEVSNIVNERPIGLKPIIGSDPEYLSPNSLQLGRCSDRISSGPFMDLSDYHEDMKPGRLKSRFILVQRMTDQFWANWQKFYFPTLIIRAKWHTARRNVERGDICLLQEADAFRADWRLCMVEEVYPDAKGNVRNVEVRVMNKQDGSSSYKPGQPNYLKRHVNHLILLMPVDEEEEGSADDQPPDASVQVVQEVHYVSGQAVQGVQDQKEVATPTTVKRWSASQDSSEDQGHVPGRGGDEVLPPPYQVDEELGGECSRGRWKTTELVSNAAATILS